MLDRMKKIITFAIVKCFLHFNIFMTYLLKAIWITTSEYTEQNKNPFEMRLYQGADYLI